MYKRQLLHAHPRKESRKEEPLRFCDVVVQSLNCVQLFATPWTAARQASLSPSPGACSNSCSSSRWCHPTISSSVFPFLLLPSIFPSIRVFSNEWGLCIRWPRYSGMYWAVNGERIILVNLEAVFGGGFTMLNTARLLSKIWGNGGQWEQERKTIPKVRVLHKKLLLSTGHKSPPRIPSANTCWKD